MKKWRQIAFILMLALSLTTFAACGRDDDHTGTAQKNDTVNDVTAADKDNAAVGEGNEADRGTDATTDPAGADDGVLDQAADRVENAVDNAGETVKDGLTDDNRTGDGTAADKNAMDSTGVANETGGAPATGTTTDNNNR